MRGNDLVKVLLTLLLLTGCSSLVVHDAKDCTVAGVIAAGAECGTTLSHKPSSMNYEEFVQFLEPQQDRGGAICRSAEDYFQAKTELEQACILLKKKGIKCSYQVEATIDGMNKVLNLQKP